MRAIRRELEQRFEGWSLEFELEQLSDEFEHECGVVARLQSLKLRNFETVELQG